MSMFYTLSDIADAASDQTQRDLLMQQMAKAQQDMDTATDMAAMMPLDTPGSPSPMGGLAKNMLSAAQAKMAAIRAQLDALDRNELARKQADTSATNTQLFIKLGIGAGAILGLVYIYKKFR